jgi:hypothetical protein
VPRPAIAALGFAAAGLAVFAVARSGTGIWQLVLFAAAPDLALLVGMAPGLAPGELHPRAVGLYNAVHRMWGPAALMVGALLLLHSTAWLVGGLAWLAHIAFDRSLGFGLRDAHGFQRQPGSKR